MTRHPITLIKNQKTWAREGQSSLYVDIAVPDGKGPFPTLVFIHGGGFTEGTKDWYESHIKDMAKRGYVAVSVSYGLTSKKPDGTIKNPFPHQVLDVLCTLCWLKNQAGSFQIDPDRMAFIGASSGGYLALMAGLVSLDNLIKLAESRQISVSNLEEIKSQCAGCSPRVKVIVNLCGITDLEKLYTMIPIQEFKQRLEWAFGGTPSAQKEFYAQASPFSHINKDQPKILSIYGGKDDLVPPLQGILFDQKSAQLKAHHQLIIFPDADHEFIFEDKDRTLNVLTDFLRKNLD